MYLLYNKYFIINNKIQLYKITLYYNKYILIILLER